ncbi:MAG: four-carbon acid sugar kinase family protein [Albidovulum sp.]|nr:four-carbon acid sugar kinase family protein [Albidovulum sp.]MDE0308002.1 four-carbon acid sugar kinase family protein [Albidovulum sp.]MDE0533293.1 four-carbon acid sugar kinase family protein [Albidovulum sp.]
MDDHNADAGRRLPEGTLVSWYGDDFTGAAAVMEVLSFAGLPSVLFAGEPSPEQLENYRTFRGIGIAGTARSRSPAWMEQHLPGAFKILASINAPIAHYKTCSTFDSSVEIGSIGKAAEIAAPILGGDWHPMIVAAPEIRRYQAFGNLFAAFGESTYRLDRHPVMSRHPVTPMREADILRHMALQTSMRLGLIDIADMAEHGIARAFERELGNGAEVVAIDIIDERTLADAGALVWRRRGKRTLALGSQGVEYALIAHWRREGLLAREQAAFQNPRTGRTAAVSGSCSPVTARQIEWAGRNGFSPIRVNPSLAVEPAAWKSEQERARVEALDALGSGSNPLIYSALGPDDRAIAEFREAVAVSEKSLEDMNAAVGHGLGAILHSIVKRTGIRRGAIAGGDTSSHGSTALGIFAFTALAPIAPGGGLCRACSDDPDIEGFEIALKGGQIGQEDFFGRVRNGGSSPQ